MYQKLGIPPAGVVENMSYYSCPNCHHDSDIFGFGGGVPQRGGEQGQDPADPHPVVSGLPVVTGGNTKITKTTKTHNVS